MALMQRCWAQRPEERPTFGDVMVELRCVRGGGGPELRQHRVWDMHGWQAEAPSIVCMGPGLLVANAKECCPSCPCYLQAAVVAGGQALWQEPSRGGGKGRPTRSKRH